jgi:hypothetical protein
MTTDLRLSSLATWNKLTTQPFLWRYPTYYIKGTRSLVFVSDSDKRQWFVSLMGESLTFFIWCCVPLGLLVAEILSGQNFGFLPNIGLVVVALLSYYSSMCSFTMLKHRGQVAAGMALD